MAFTRSQATALLNQAEMRLYDESRVNALRALDAAAIGQRIERARKARDRARDLLQRQKLASRAKTGSKRGAGGDANQRSKRKAELLTDILKRFEGQLKPAQKREAQAAAAKAAPRASGKRTAATTGPAKAAPARRGAATRTAKASAGTASAASARKAGKAGPRAAERAGTRGVATGADRRTGAGAARAITPGRALANTRRLLEAKRARQRQGQPWQTLDPAQDHLPQAGYQSPQAAERAEALHAGESRLAPIQGSISTRDRKHQGRRDHRNDPE